MSEAQQIKRWLQSLNYHQYYSNFIDNGYDEWDTISYLDLNTLKLIGITKLGHAQKILKNIPNNIKLSCSSNKNAISSSIPSQTMHIPHDQDTKLFKSLEKRKEKQKQALRELLANDGVIRKPPDFLHNKAKNAYYIPRKTTTKIRKDNTLYNEFIVDINEQADLAKPHWTSDKVAVEAKFRVKLHLEIETMEESLSNIDITRSIGSVFQVKNDKNKYDKINQNANNLLNNLKVIDTAILQCQSILNDCDNNTINILKIKNADGKPMTYYAAHGFWNTKKVVSIKDEGVFNYYDSKSKDITKYRDNLQNYVNSLKAHQLYRDIQKRADKKAISNANKNIKQKVYYKNSVYRDRSKMNKKSLSNGNILLGVLFSCSITDNNINCKIFHLWVNVLIFLGFIDLSSLRLSSKHFLLHTKFYRTLFGSYLYINHKQEKNYTYLASIFEKLSLKTGKSLKGTIFLMENDTVYSYKILPTFFAIYYDENEMNEEIKQKAKRLRATKMC